MKNMINLAPQPMLNDLASQLQSTQKARPARTVNSDKEFNIKEPQRDNSKLEDAQPHKKDKEEDFDNVLSGQVNEQRKPQEYKKEAKAKSDQGTQTVAGRETPKKNKKNNLFTNIKHDKTNLLKGAAPGLNSKSLAQNITNQNNDSPEHARDMLPFALKSNIKSRKAQNSAQLAELTFDKNIIQNKNSKNKGQGKFALDTALFEQVEEGQEVNLKTNSTQEKNNSSDGSKLAKQMEQQNQTQNQKQAENAKSTVDNFIEAQEQALTKSAENLPKPTETRSETPKFENHNFGFKGQDNQMPSNIKSTAKAGPTSSAGINKNFAQAAEMMDPKVKVQIENHQANLRITTEKAGEVAVRLQMQQEGVTDIKLVGENAEIFNKKDELQAALQSEGLDLGHFEFAQDFGQKENDHDGEEGFENEDNGTVIASKKNKTSGRVRNGATMHVQA